MYTYLYINYIDYNTLKQELKEASSKTMAKLCSNWCRKEKLNFTCCRVIKPCTQSILTSFSHLAKPRRSQIFRRMWNKNMSTFLESWKKKMSTNPEFNDFITQKKIIEVIWQPTVTYCQKLVDRLKSGTISMSEIEEIFCDDKDLTDIKLSCDSLLDSLISSKLVKDSSNKQWIHTVCRQIKHHRLSLKCIECAQAIFSLRDKLKLKGDFSRIKVVGDKVTIQLVLQTQLMHSALTTIYKILNVICIS